MRKGNKIFAPLRILLIHLSMLGLSLFTIHHLPFTSSRALAFDFKDAPAVGLAFLTNLAIHEAGHYVIADQSGAEGNRLNFFTRDRNSFFLGLSTVAEIDERARPAYHLAGEVAASYTFETALKQYREKDTVYNRSLLFFSMTDFLWYTVYAFYLSPHENEKFDPIGLSDSMRTSRETIFLVALTQSSLNAVRVLTRQDRLIPHFIIDRYFVGFAVKVPF